jgi:hypothetical protein
MLAADRKLGATLLATCREYAAAVLGLHTQTETVLVDALTVVGLECTFHCSLLFLVIMIFLLFLAVNTDTYTAQNAVF